MKVKEESEIVDFKSQHSENDQTMASGPITSWQIDGETIETETFFLGAPKSL